MQSKRATITKNVQQCVAKLVLLGIVMSVELSLGIESSYMSFYLSVGLQAANNIAEGFAYLNPQRYTHKCVWRDLGVLAGSVLALISALCYGFSEQGKAVHQFFENPIVALVVGILVSLVVANLGYELVKHLGAEEKINDTGKMVLVSESDELDELDESK